MYATGVIVQQNEQNIKKFRWLQMLATFHQFGLQKLCDSQHNSTCNSNGNSLLAIVDEKKYTTRLLSPGHVFHGIGIGNIQP